MVPQTSLLCSKLVTVFDNVHTYYSFCFLIPTLNLITLCNYLGCNVPNHAYVHS